MLLGGAQMTGTTGKVFLQEKLQVLLEVHLEAGRKVITLCKKTRAI